MSYILLSSYIINSFLLKIQTKWPLVQLLIALAFTLLTLSLRFLQSLKKISKTSMMVLTKLIPKTRPRDHYAVIFQNRDTALMEINVSSRMGSRNSDATSMKTPTKQKFVIHLVRKNIVFMVLDVISRTRSKSKNRKKAKRRSKTTDKLSMEAEIKANCLQSGTLIFDHFYRLSEY